MASARQVLRFYRHDTMTNAEEQMSDEDETSSSGSSSGSDEDESTSRTKLSSEAASDAFSGLSPEVELSSPVDSDEGAGASSGSSFSADSSDADSDTSSDASSDTSSEEDDAESPETNKVGNVGLTKAHHSVASLPKLQSPRTATSLPWPPPKKIIMHHASAPGEGSEATKIRNRRRREQKKRRKARAALERLQGEGTLPKTTTMEEYKQHSDELATQLPTPVDGDEAKAVEARKAELLRAIEPRVEKLTFFTSPGNKSFVPSQIPPADANSLETSTPQPSTQPSKDAGTPANDGPEPQGRKGPNRAEAEAAMQCSPQDSAATDNQTQEDTGKVP